MQLNPRKLIVGSSLSFVAMAAILAGCGSTTSSTAASGPKGCQKVGVLLPESASSARWEGKDHPLIVAALKANGFSDSNIKVTNAGGDDALQLTQAETDLTQGYCILIVAPSDSAKASAIVQKAKASNVPVISYDRLINDPDINSYVSFDNFAVGVAQGKYIAANYSKYVTPGHVNMVFINGAQTDNNALLFHDGVHSILDPLVTAGTLKNQKETYTPKWDNPTAQIEMDGYLTALNNDVSVAYVANDGMASTVIASLKAQKLNGKVLVTGQDATVAGIQNILLGDQAMTVYKQVSKEAQGSADLAKALRDTGSSASVATSTVKNGSVNTPADLLPIVSVDKTNIASTVIAEGYVTKADVCANLPAGTAPDICS